MMIYLSIFYKYRLQRIILLLVLAFYSLVLCAQFVDYERITPHPRLLLTQGGEEAVKKSIATFPSLLKVHKRILEESDEILIQQMAERVMEGKRLLSVSRLALKRIFYLSYAYRMTKEEKYAYRATQEMLSVSRFPDWNPSHFLDVGEMVLALKAWMPLLLMSGFTGQPLIGILFVMVVYCMVHLQFLRMCRIRQKKL